LCHCADDILGELSGWWNRTVIYSGDDIHEKWLEILAGILHGYASINPLTAEEKQAVYYVMCSFKLTFWCMLGNTMSEADGNELKGWNKTSCDNLRYIVENKEKIDNIF